MTVVVSIDEIDGGEEISVVNSPEDTEGWGWTKNNWQFGEYQIREIRSDRGHLAVEVEGPLRYTAGLLARAYYEVIYWKE